MKNFTRMHTGIRGILFQNLRMGDKMVDDGYFSWLDNGEDNGHESLFLIIAFILSGLMFLYSGFLIGKKSNECSNCEAGVNNEQK